MKRYIGLNGQPLSNSRIQNTLFRNDVILPVLSAATAVWALASGDQSVGPMKSAFTTCAFFLCINGGYVGAMSFFDYMVQHIRLKRGNDHMIAIDKMPDVESIDTKKLWADNHNNVSSYSSNLIDTITKDLRRTCLRRGAVTAVLAVYALYSNSQDFGTWRAGYAIASPLLASIVRDALAFRRWNNVLQEKWRLVERPRTHGRRPSNKPQELTV
jgi:hypothetical protein